MTMAWVLPRMIRSARVRFAVVACAILGIPGIAAAQAFPAKPVRMVVAFSPGGGGDISARIVAAAMTSALGQSVLVENRPGAGGTVAAAMVTKAPADGYTLLVAEQGATVFATSLFPKIQYDPAKDLAVVNGIFRTPFIIVGGPTLKATNLKELLEDARVNPGKIAYGHSGIGTMHHLTMEIFKQRAGIDLSAVAYKGGAQSVQDAASGQIPLAISGLVTTDGLIKAGRLRPIAVTSKGRFPSHPEVPALSEIVPGFEAAIWVGIWAPAGTPREVLAVLNGAASKALQSSEVIKKFDDIGLEPLPRTLDEIHQQWQGELAFWPEQIRKMRITLD